MSSWGQPSQTTRKAHAVLLDIAVEQITEISEDLGNLYRSFPSLRGAMVQSLFETAGTDTSLKFDQAYLAASRERRFHRRSIVVLGESYGRASIP